MAARGTRNKAIGEALHISEGTVKTHLHLIYQKLGVRSRLALATYLHDKGML
jgi:two-component system nitrate/nitrite response regulator NarL